MDINKRMTEGKRWLFALLAVLLLLGTGCGKRADELTQEDLEKIVRFACTAASLSTQKHGGITSVPAQEDVTALL